MREASNKIIHATSVMVEFSDTESEDSCHKAWDGKYHVHGTRWKSPRHVELCVESWAKAISCFLELLSDNEKIIYMGQDFS